MTTISQRNFASGEVSPSLYARVDLIKYATGLRTCKNALVLRYGGVANRPGTFFVGEVKDSSKQIRLIPFIFNDSQTYVLEFGEFYMRVIKNAVPQTDSTSTITGITQANPAVVTTSGSHGLSNGQEVFISGVSGMTQVNNRNFKIANVTATTFQLQDMTSTNLDSTGYDAYTSGGISYEIYEIATPYTEAEVGELNYVQSGDVITIVHPNHRPRELLRFGDIDWELNTIELRPQTTQPTNFRTLTVPSGSETFQYKLTAVDAETGEESLAAWTGSSSSVSAISKADPAVVGTSSAHGLATGDEIYITNVSGMTEVNGRIFKITVITAQAFELDGIDSSDYTTYSSGGTAYKTNLTISSVANPTAVAPIEIQWNSVPSAIEYNIYKESNGVFGQIGVASGTTFSDINITPNTSFTPPASRNPFIGANNYPSVVTYIQQRLGFANTNNDTEKIYLSRISNFKNFTTSNPTQADDAITFNLAGREVNAVKSLVDLGRLVILTNGGEWAAEGDGGTITPTTINTKQYSYNGSGDLQPILIDGAAIYQQARGSIIRDLEYRFEVDGYQGNDLTIFSAHLFDKFTLTDWAYQQIPHSVVWTARSDGTLLGMTYVKSQEVIAWHRHDLGGQVENTVVIPEGNEDVLYVTVKRTINGQTRRYIEKLVTRQITNIVDSKFMDSHLTYDGRNTSDSNTVTLSGGTDWLYTETLTITSSTALFSSNDVGNAIHMTGSDGALIRFTLTGFTSSTIMTGKANKTVPASLQGTATNNWTKAVDQLAGLWHLEGENVAVFADGFVVASPNNPSYDLVTVTNGLITLDKPYGVIHVGLPYLTDIETLDVDTPNGETLADKRVRVNEVTIFAEETRGVWVGPRPPLAGESDIEGLREMKLRDEEDYDSPPSLTTDKIEVTIKAEWNSNGRIFIRQIDPIPMTILSVNPAGLFPYSN